MSFFKDFKEDLSQAVNELMPDESTAEAEDAATIPVDDTPDDISDGLDSLLSGLDDFNGEFADSADEVPKDIELMAVEDIIAQSVAEEMPAEPAEQLIVDDVISEADELAVAQEVSAVLENVSEEIADMELETSDAGSAAFEEPAPEMVMPEPEPESMVPDSIIPEMIMPEQPLAEAAPIEKLVSEDVEMSIAIDDFANEPATDENSIITAGMIIDGNIKALGSLEVMGSVTGDIEVRGKLEISGEIKGNSKAAEIFADSARITGEVVSLGSVKVGQSSVIIGNISATSAVIAGAVKGDIDVHGPVILDTSAIVMGDIKSKSVQINNGAVIEGRCSQCYADVSPTSFFNDLK